MPNTENITTDNASSETASPETEVAAQAQPSDAEHGDSDHADTNAETETATTTPTDDLDALSQTLVERLNEADVDNVQMKDENAQMKDEVLRARAEVENIQRRSNNEIIATRKFAVEGFAQELLAVMDSLEQAAMVELDENTSEAVQQMKQGLGLTLKQFGIVMGKFAVVEVEAAPGVRFDPELHQAISMVPSDEIDVGHIVTVMQKGFMLKERLLRPAMVVVAAKAEFKSETETQVEPEAEVESETEAELGLEPKPESEPET